MLGALSLSHSTADFFSLNRNSLFRCGFPISPRPVAPRRIAVRSPFTDGGGSGGIVFEKEFEFTPSFSEYLKAIEFLKNERYNTDKSSECSNPSNNIPRRKMSVKKIVREEEKSSDEVTVVQDNSRKGSKGALYKEDSRKGDFRGWEIVEKKHYRDLKMRNRKMSDISESESLVMERAAFKPLEDGDEVIGKPRVTMVDMEERILKLAKWWVISC